MDQACFKSDKVGLNAAHVRSGDIIGRAQPVLGDALTAAITAVDQNLGVTITVASTAWYQIGDRIVADPLQLNQDTYRITQILSSTQMVGMLEGIAGHTHNSGALLQLAIACGNVVLQNLSAADLSWLEPTTQSRPGLEENRALSLSHSRLLNSQTIGS